MKMTFLADYVCPYSSVGVAEMLHAPERRGISGELDMKGYRFDPDVL